MCNAKAYAASSATSPLASASISRRQPTDQDVQIEILFCGVCHSDLHTARNEWSDLVGVGCLVDSDGTCPHCQANHEQFCANATLTYNAPDKHLGGVTYGGYSDSIVVNERFLVRIPANLDLAGAAPLLCAGITTYSPLRHWGMTTGKKVGIVGLGGLGHMGVKFAHALGAHVQKINEAYERMLRSDVKYRFSIDMASLKAE